MPPVSNGCKFSLFFFFSCLQHIPIAQFLRLHVYFCTFLQPQNGILSSWILSFISSSQNELFIEMLGVIALRYLTEKKRFRIENRSTRSAVGSWKTAWRIFKTLQSMNSRSCAVNRLFHWQGKRGNVFVGFWGCGWKKRCFRDWREMLELLVLAFVTFYWTLGKVLVFNKVYEH